MHTITRPSALRPPDRDSATLEKIYAAERELANTARIEREFLKPVRCANDSPVHDASVICLGAFGGWQAHCSCGWRVRPPEFKVAVDAHRAVYTHLVEVGETVRADEYARHHL